MAERRRVAQASRHGATPPRTSRHRAGGARPSALPADPLWYKDAVIYELSVRSFQDGNGDGIGDFRGLTQRLDYLSKLGINCLWLLPFYPSPMRDGGYDISDYTSINPQLGTMRDFSRFIRAAHERGIRVIGELVINHTSDQHPWFQRARRAPRGSAARNMYVWSDSPSKYAGTRIIFSDTESSNWTWDPVAGQYYWHRFFSHQPDLNFANPRVVAAVKRLMKFWFDLGVDGLRLDAIPYLCEREGTSNQDLPETHAILKELRAFVDANFEDRMLLAEANGWPADVVDYFGEGDECHMAFHFPVMPRLFMALRQEDRHPIVDILDQTPRIPDTAQWVLFLRNHDELTLEMVKDDERDYMYSAYATDPRMRLNVGIRRRLAPLLGNSRRAMELLNSLLFSLPGTPLLYYGDEIGMGDNIFLGDRDGVRTPMQWTGDRNAGFSSADAAQMSLPVIADPLYGYQAVNVEAQERSPSSFLNWMRRMIALRRERAVFSRGSMEMLHPANRKVLAFVRRFEGETVLVVANLSRFVQPAQLDLSDFAGLVPVEMVGKTPFPAITEDAYHLALGPHTFYWFDLQPQAAGTAPEAPARGELPALAVSEGWGDLFEGEALAELEQLLPGFLARQRWFGHTEHDARTVRVRDVTPLLRGPSAVWWATIDVDCAGEPPSTYALPLAVATGRGARRISSSMPGAVLAEVHSARGEGLLCDALASDAACLAMVEYIQAAASSPTRRPGLVAQRTRVFGPLFEALDEEPLLTRGATDHPEPCVRLGEQFVLRLVRHVEAGIHPGIEVSTHLEAAGFERAPKLAGSISHTGPADPVATLATLHEYIWNQGDAWHFTLEQLRRYFEETSAQVLSAESRDGEVPPAAMPGDQFYIEAARLLGVRTAEMHLALARSLGDPAFEPEPLAKTDIDGLIEAARARLGRVVAALRRHPAGIEPPSTEIDALAAAARGLGPRLRRLARGAPPLQRIRVHGDYQLDHVLWVRNDFAIVGFEGDATLPLAARRRKASALSDLAAMLRSFSTAADMGLYRYADTMPDRAFVATRLSEVARRWEADAASSFLAGYLGTAGGAPFLPQGASVEGTLGPWLDFYLIERALADLETALERRPERAEAALRGAARLLRSPA